MSAYAIVHVATGEVLSVSRARPDPRMLRDESAEALRFETVEALERDPRVAAYRLRAWSESTLARVDVPDVEAKVLKVVEAWRWIDAHPTDDGAVPDADAFPMLEIEHRVRGRSAHESARAILAAVRRDREGDQGAIAVEERRVAAKSAAARYLRSRDAHTDRIGRDGD